MVATDVTSSPTDYLGDEAEAKQDNVSSLSQPLSISCYPHPLANPKIVERADGEQSPLTRYYAGFSEQFVTSVVRRLGLDQYSMLLDPWNGSGTTTYVCQRLGISSVGLDLNPAMSLAAKARCVVCDNNDLKSDYDKINELAASAVAVPVATDGDDMLQTWLSSEATSAVRKLIGIISKLTGVQTPFSNPNDASDRFSLYFSILTATVRNRLKELATSNPTWIRMVVSEEERIELTFDELFVEFMDNFRTHMARKRELFALAESLAKPMILRGNSQHIPLDSSSIDAVITSPPYCTRIDYAVATAVELAVLGATRRDFKTLRTSLMGSTSVSTPPDITKLGPICRAILEDVRLHQSYASQRYYYKTYCNYFYSLGNSISELSRVLKRGGKVALVLQNSFHKDIELDIISVAKEMGLAHSLYPFSSVVFANSKTKAHLHPVVREQGRKKILSETMVLFEKL